MDSNASGERWPTFILGGDEGAVKPLNNLIRRSELVLERALESDRSRASLAASAKKLSLLADAELAGIYSSIAAAALRDPSGQIRCQARCAHCCYRVPEVSLPELALIWEAVLQGFTPEAREALKRRVEVYVRETAPYRPAALNQARSACPFLENGLCSVYAERPLSCRALNSTDVAACESIRAGRLPVEQRPAWADLGYATMAARTGLRVGAFFEGVGGDTVDLGHALALLFTQPDALDQSLNGKNLFLGSRSEGECEALNFSTIANANGPAYLSKDELSLPSGNLPAAEAEFLRAEVGRYLVSGNFAEYLSRVGKGSVGRLMSRINVPRAAASEEEIEASREAFVQAMREFSASDFSAESAFNALSFHQTMSLHYQGRDNLELLREHGHFVVEGISARALPQFATPPREGSRKAGKLRVGYLSGGLNGSNNGKWALQWVRNHSKEIETFCFLTGPRSDETTDQFRACADHFYWLNRSVPANAAFIRSLDLDVVIFTDIGFYARMTQYSSFRLAPVQCTAWGGPETSGLPTVDYYLSSDYMEPADGERFYSEKLIRLPRTGLVFSPVQTSFPERERAYFGLPDSGPLVLMGQACMKLVPQYDVLFARISERLGTEIVFLESDAPGDSAVVKERLKKAGVRAKWIPAVTPVDYLALMNLADVSLDPHMWSGGNTTIQALALGTPVVTWPGPFMRARHSLAFLRQANALGLVATNGDDFVNLACDFDRQREAIKDMDANALFGDLGIVRALDEFLFSVASL